VRRIISMMDKPMSANLPDTGTSWVDPDDAPDLTDEFFDKGVWRVGQKVVSAEEGVAAFKASATG
jgi:hypothetical protein